MNHFYHVSCRSEGTYPVPVGLLPNWRQAQMLMGVYAGEDSELTSVLQFIYQFLMASDKYRPMAFALKHIAMVDMQHLVMIGSCIEQLGEEPRYGVRRGAMFRCWNSGYVKYDREMRNMLTQSLILEYEIVDSYARIIRGIGEEQIIALLERIILDEQVHISLLESMLTFL